MIDYHTFSLFCMMLKNHFRPLLLVPFYPQSQLNVFKVSSHSLTICTFSKDMQSPSWLGICFLSLMRKPLKLIFLVINSVTIFSVTAVIGNPPYHSEQLQENKITFLWLSHSPNFPIDSYFDVFPLYYESPWKMSRQNLHVCLYELQGSEQCFPEARN